MLVLVWEGGGDSEEGREEGAEAAVWSNSSALAVDARRAVRCGARLMRVQWRRVDTGGAASWRDADLTSLHHQREVPIYLKPYSTLATPVSAGSVFKSRF